MFRSLASIVVAVLCVSGHAASSAAQERPVAEAVSIANADACIVADPLVAAAADWLGRPTVDARIAVLVDVAMDGASASVIAIRDGAEVAVRRFDPLPTSCPDRRTVVSLGVALAIDALLLDVLEAPRAPPVEVAPAPEIAPSAATSTSVAIELAGEGGVVLGTLEGVAGIGAASIALVLPPLVRLRFGVLASSPGSFALGSGAVDVSLALGRIDVCLVASVGMLELDGCVGALAGAALATGRDYTTTRSATQPWIGAAPRLEAALWLAEPLALTLAADGLFAFAPPSFDVTDASGTVLHAGTLPVAGLVVAAGLRVRFR